MKQQNETPLYATLLYSVRKRLGISIAEYFYLDMVYHLSKNEKGWCYKSLDAIGEDMGISRIGVVKLRNRLIERKLIKKNIKGYVKTTEIYNKVIRGGDTTYNFVTKPYNKVYPSVKQSIPKNNNRITKDKEIDIFNEPQRKSTAEGIARAKANLYKKLGSI